MKKNNIVVSFTILGVLVLAPILFPVQIASMYTLLGNQLIRIAPHFFLDFLQDLGYQPDVVWFAEKIKFILPVLVNILLIRLLYGYRFLRYSMVVLVLLLFLFVLFSILYKLSDFFYVFYTFIYILFGFCSAPYAMIIIIPLVDYLFRLSKQQ